MLANSVDPDKTQYSVALELCLHYLHRCHQWDARQLGSNGNVSPFLFKKTIYCIYKIVVYIQISAFLL